MRRLVLLFVMATAVCAARAEAITLREIIDLSKTGLSDEVLLALIEIERRVYPVDPETVKLLKDSGVSERVIVAMIRSGRSRSSEPEPVVVTEPAPPPAPQPQVVVIDHHDHHDTRRVREVAVPVPVYVAVPVYVRTPRHIDGRRSDHVPAAAPASSITLPHSGIGLSAPPPRPTSDPPGWRVVPLSRRSDPPGWQKSPYLKP